MRNNTILCDEEVRDLGIMVRRDLSSKAHTAKATTSASRLLWALRRSFSFWTENSVPILLKAFIRPVLEYGAPAYFPETKGECYQLEKIQRRATRMIPNLRHTTYLERCSALGLYTLEYRRTRMDLLTVFRIVGCGELPVLRSIFQLSTITNTRGHRFKLEKPRLQRVPQVRSLPARICSLWNNLPTEVVEATTLNEFKYRLDQHLWDTAGTWRREPLPGEAYPRIPYPTHRTTSS